MKTKDSASRRKAMDALKPPVFSQSHMFTTIAPPGGAENKNEIPRMMVSKADMPTEPAPINGIIFLGSLPPDKERIRKPSNGMIGMRARRIVIMVSVYIFKFVQPIHVK